MSNVGVKVAVHWLGAYIYALNLTLKPMVLALTAVPSQSDCGSDDQPKARLVVGWSAPNYALTS